MTTGVAKLTFDRVTAYIFGEIWAGLANGPLYGKSSLEMFRAYWSGLRIADQEIHRWLPPPESDQAGERSARAYPEVAQWVIQHSRERLEKEWSRKVEVLADNSKATGGELWFMILLGIVEPSHQQKLYSQAEEFLRRVYELNIQESESAGRLTDALKNCGKAIRKKEAQHRRVRERLVIALAIDLKTDAEGAEAAESFRNKLEANPEEEVPKLIEESIRAYIAALYRTTGVLCQLMRNLLRSRL